MLRYLRLIFFFFLFLIPYNLYAASKHPVMFVVPFAQVVTLSKNTDTNVNIVIQNNSGVNLTITNLVPQIPSSSSVTATIAENNCNTLAPQESCDATAQLFGLTKPGNENLNISVCSFKGTLCSRIKQAITVTNSPLVEIDISPTNPAIASGTTKQFYATGVYADNTTQDITNAVNWGSSNQTAATISNSSNSKGLATGISPGTSTISATLNGLSATTTLNVSAVTLTSITILPVNPNLAKGMTQQFYAIGIYSDNSYQNLTSSVTWNSSNPAIATISNTASQAGQATGKSVGSTSITATMGSVSGSTTLTISAAVLTAISVTPTNSFAAKGTRQPFKATGIYSDNSTNDLTSVVTWSTGSAAIAIISNRPLLKGLGLAVDEGTTTVNAKFGSLIGSTNFTVTAATLDSIFVSPTNLTIKAGETQQYSAIGIYTDFSIQDLTSTSTWSSSNNAVARISNTPLSQGFATAIAAGTTTISATNSGVVGSTPMTVHAASLVSIAVTPATPTIANGTQQQFTATGTYSDTSTRDLTDSVTWISTSPTVAIISNADGSKGLATTQTAGSTTINAGYEGITGNTTLTVSAATLTSIAVTPMNASLPVNTSGQFTATGTYSDSSTKVITKEVTWRSSDSSKAIVSNATETKGLVTGIAQGAATISAIQGSATGNTTINIVNASIGDNLNGGKVACLDGGLNNLITANTNNATNINWGGTGTTTNAQSTIDGKENTARIVTVLGAGTSYAAGVCAAYEIDSAGNTPCVGGNVCYNDWFLPSTNQIACLRSNRNAIDGFDKTNYWSSTEDSSASSFNAWYITFANNGHPPETAAKTQLYAVRCVRLISAFP